MQFLLIIQWILLSLSQPQPISTVSIFLFCSFWRHQLHYLPSSELHWTDTREFQIQCIVCCQCIAFQYFAATAKILDVSLLSQTFSTRCSSAVNRICALLVVLNAVWNVVEERFCAASYQWFHSILHNSAEPGILSASRSCCLSWCRCFCHACSVSPLVSPVHTSALSPERCSEIAVPFTSKIWSYVTTALRSSVAAGSRTYNLLLCCSCVPMSQ